MAISLKGFRKKKPNLGKKSSIGKVFKKKGGRKQTPRQAFLKIFMKELSGSAGSSLIAAFAKGDAAIAQKAAAKLIATVMAKADVKKEK